MSEPPPGRRDGAPDVQADRGVIRVVAGVPAEDGAGVKLTRIIGSPQLDMWDPFLLLDRFESENPEDYIAGFPSHPHRGFETVTYLLAGRLRHKDSTGREGVIEAGGVQWMTAARGIVHSEMPEQVEGRLAGFQLWINLPAAKKMSPPGYQEFSAAEIPVVRRGPSVVLRVIAGTTSEGVSGPVQNVPSQPRFYDVELSAGSTFTEPLPPLHAAFVYVVEGTVTVAGTESRGDLPLSKNQLGLLSRGGRVRILAEADSSRLLLVSGKEFAEPVARAGPFVMNTREEVVKAFSDFQSGRF